jgi:hypothetical protein
MSNRIGLAALAAAASLAVAGFAKASEPASAAPFTLSPSRPVYADAPAPPPKPLTAILNMTPLGKPMADNNISATGYIEGSWTYNFDTPDNQTNTTRVFDFEDQDPTLNQLDLAISKSVTVSKDKFDWGFDMEWMWGGDARLIHSDGLFDHYGFPLFPGSPGTGDGPDEQFDLVQLYAQFNAPVGNGLLITAGKFVTLLGYETINPTTNPLYSHSVIFGFAIPFTNTGIMGKYQINDQWSATLAVVRGWDQTLEDNNDYPSYMGQIAYSQGKLGVILNVITGVEGFHDNSDYRTVFDGVVTYALSDQLTLAWNGDYGWQADGDSSGNGTADWCGMAVYASYKINDMFTLQGRADYFSDGNGARGIGATTESLTFGVNIHPFPSNQWASGLVFRPEIRWDHASEDIFNDGNDDNQYTIAGDIIYAF